MLLTPYDPKELEQVFRDELVVLGPMLFPAIEDLIQCQRLFWQKGFVADKPYYSLLQAAHEGIGRNCRSELHGSDPNVISLGDLVELYPNRTLQRLPGAPTPRARYWACVGDVIRKMAPDDLDVALRKRWAAFAAEANSYADAPLAAQTRDRITDALLRECATEAGFATFSVSRASVRKWHPRPDWVDAAIGVLQLDGLDIAILSETSRPRKYVALPDFQLEPSEQDAHFDKAEMSFWAIPKRNITVLHSAALKIKRPLTLYYRDFYSIKGLRRIADAAVAELGVLCRL